MGGYGQHHRQSVLLLLSLVVYIGGIWYCAIVPSFMQASLAIANCFVVSTAAVAASL